MVSVILGTVSICLKLTYMCWFTSSSHRESREGRGIHLYADSLTLCVGCQGEPRAKHTVSVTESCNRLLYLSLRNSWLGK